MSERSKRVIAVVGATGAQGGGLVRAIHNDPSGQFIARAITRDANGQHAQDLRRLGAEVVAADIDDPESLKRAFEGAYGAYCVTFFWAHFSPEKEQAQARGMAEAAKHANLQHVIWSTLEDTRQWVPLDDERMPTLMGAYKVPHFDAKGSSDHSFTDLGVPVTFLLTSFYWDNLIGFGMGPRRDQDGALEFILPMGDRRLSGIASEDIGKCAYGLFKQGTTSVGRRVGIAGEHLTGEQMASHLSRALGQKVNYRAIPFEVYRGLGFPGAEDLGNMFQFYHDFEDEFTRARNLDEARSLNPELLTFEQSLERYKDRIQIQ
ncbi:MAG TPA: NmrA/HSCARG family protein [Gemmatimonadales bacterium]|nr:NmrA/HSCARG family protein [Gemmatimonadales bacterium]